MRPELAQQLGLERVSVDAFAGLRQAAQDELCIDSFRHFVQAAIREIPATLKLAGPISWTWYIEALVDFAERWCFGDLPHGIVNIKNKSWKSGVFSVLLPAWSWLKDPTLQWFTGGHAQKLAVDHTRMTRDVLRTEWYARLRDRAVAVHDLPPWELKDDQDVKSYYMNTAGGHRYAAWPPAGTGAAGSRFLIDDPLGIHDAYSDVASEEANRWVMQTVMSRMNNPATDRLCVIQHRLRTDDTTASLLARFPGKYHVLDLPLEYEPDRAPLPGALDVPGWEDPRAELGESLDPDRWPEDVIEAEKGSQGPLYAALSQQRPTAAGQQIVQRTWVREYTTLPTTGDLVMSWDFSFKGLDPTKMTAAQRKSQKRSKVCGQVWLFDGQAAYVVDEYFDHADYREQKRAFLSMLLRYPNTVRAYVEDEANGSALLLEMQDILSRLLRGDVTPLKDLGLEGLAGEVRKLRSTALLPVNPGKKGGKYQRFAAVASYFRAGQVYVPPRERAPWAGPLVDCWCDFPGVPYDEQVDVTSQVLSEEWLPKETTEGRATVEETLAKLRALSGAPQR